MLSWRESRATIDESCWLNSVSNRFLPTGGSAKGWAGWQRHACHHCNNNRHTSRQIYRLSYIITINFIQTKPDKSVATTTTNIRENPDNVFCFFFVSSFIQLIWVGYCSVRSFNTGEFLLHLPTLKGELRQVRIVPIKHLDIIIMFNTWKKQKTKNKKQKKKKPIKKRENI